MATERHKIKATEKRVFRRLPLITPKYPHAGIFVALLQSYKRPENSTGCL